MRHAAELRVDADSSAEVTLNDANYQEVAKLQVKTNAFGTAAGEFTVAGRPASWVDGPFAPREAWRKCGSRNTSADFRSGTEGTGRRRAPRQTLHPEGRS